MAKKRKIQVTGPVSALVDALVNDKPWHPVAEHRRASTRRKVARAKALKERNKLRLDAAKAKVEITRERETLRRQKVTDKDDRQARRVQRQTAAQQRLQARKVQGVIVRAPAPVKPTVRTPQPVASAPAQSAAYVKPAKRPASAAATAGICGEPTVESGFKDRCQRRGKCPPGTHVEGQKAVAGAGPVGNDWPAGKPGRPVVPGAAGKNPVTGETLPSPLGMIPGHKLLGPANLKALEKTNAQAWNIAFRLLPGAVDRSTRSEDQPRGRRGRS